ncbi:conjugative transposon protein TraM [Tannerella forsythia]
MNKEHEGNDPKAEVVEKQKKKADKPGKELTPQEIQRRKKMLVYPLFFLIFAGAMWLIFAPSGNKENTQPDGFNPELPIPKDEAIVGDKREAYEREAMQSKQQEKMRTLQDFSLLMEDEHGDYVADARVTEANNASGYTEGRNPRNDEGLRSSAHAYQDINRQLSSWYDQPAEETDEQTQLALEYRVQELERQLEEKSSTDQQLDMIEKSYAIAAKYMAASQAKPVTEGEQQGTQSEEAVNTSGKLPQKAVSLPVSQVRPNVVTLLSAPMEDETFLEQYVRPRNMGFITVAGKEDVTEKNSIRASVYRTVTLSNGKELQLRLLEPMRAGDILIPAHTILVGSAKLGGERLHITISSIQYADNVIPVELEVYDIDGVQGIFVPNSTEINAAKEIAANMGASTGSNITIGGNVGSQLAADLGRNAMQGISQYISKKMREVKVTLKAGYKVLLLPKT